MNDGITDKTKKSHVGKYLTIGLVIVFFVYFLLNFATNYSVQTSLKRRHDSLFTVYNDLSRSNADLDSLIKALQNNDPEAIEWVARYQWHLTRPGEKVYQLIPDGSTAEGK